MTEDDLPRCPETDHRRISCRAGIEVLVTTDVPRRPERNCPNEVVHHVPRRPDPHDEVARERSEVVHDRHFDLGIRRQSAVSREQRHQLGVTRQMDDRVIISEGQGQHRKLPVRRPNLCVSLTAGE
jgi:hypothetical protein